MIHFTRTALLMKVRKRREVMIMLISVLAFLLMLISENRSSSAAFRGVNQAARRATALSFYVPISLYISPISISFIRLISPFFNHSISMWLIHLRDLFACCSLCEKVLFEFHEFALSPDFQTSLSETAAHKNTKQRKQATISSRMFTMHVCSLLCFNTCLWVPVTLPSP